MTQLQPNIMVIDGFDQYGNHTGAIGTQGIRKDLIPHQRTFRRFHLVSLKTFPDTLGKGLVGMGNARNAVFFTKDLHPVFMTVRYHAKPDI